MNQGFGGIPVKKLLRSFFTDASTAYEAGLCKSDSSTPQMTKRWMK
jgi:hypothetical protein